MARRRTSHSETQPLNITAASHPRLIAFRMGRRINELQHRMELAWLTCEKDQRARVRALWAEILRLSRGMFTTELARLPLAQVIPDAEEEWVGRVESEWYADFHQVCLQEIATCEAGLSFALTGINRPLADVLSDQLVPIRLFLENLPHRLISPIPGEFVELCYFGYRVDQMLHAPNPHRSFQAVSTLQPHPRTNWPEGHESAPPQDVQSLRLVLQPQSCKPYLLEELQMRWTQLQFPQASFPPNDAIEPAAFVSCLELAVQGWIGIRPFELPQTSPGYLGLSIYGTRVIREGWEPSCVVESRLQLNILQQLLNRAERHTTREELTDHWEVLGGYAGSPKESTVRTQISELRTALAPLGVTIESPRFQGYRLQEIAGG